MADKIKIAVSWAASCGGCDVSILDIEARLLDLAALADIVFWPVALDFKKSDFMALPPGSIDIGIFNGAVRLSEQEEYALAFRERCKVLIAFGSCACFGGIPGLANFSDKEGIFEEVYQTTASTENPDGTRPAAEHDAEGFKLTLPSFYDTVRSLEQVVDVDIFAPGCPPPVERVNDLVDAAARYAETGELPARGTYLALDKALCDVCPRNENRETHRIETISRPHEVKADPERCFLDQGLLCLGIATRGGCEATCIAANMPCRGCFGPVSSVLDPAAEAISAIGSIAGAADENYVPPHKMKKAVRSIKDPAGTFYRFTLPSGFLNRAVTDAPKEKP